MKKTLIILAVVFGCKGSIEEKLLTAFKKDPIPVIIDLKQCPATDKAVAQLLNGDTQTEISKLEANWHQVAAEIWNNIGDSGKCNNLVNWAVQNGGLSF